MVLYALGTVEPYPDTKPLYDNDKEKYSYLGNERLRSIVSFERAYSKGGIITQGKEHLK